MIAFYKGKHGNILDKLICFFTKSKYSHCEIFDGIFCYSSSPRDGGVRAKCIELDKKWDTFRLNINIDSSDIELKKFYSETKNKKYDWIGIFLSKLIPLKIEDPNRWYCSEWSSYFLKNRMNVDIDKIQCSPGELYKDLKNKNII